MKAQEKRTDRKVHLNVHATGQISPLMEFGQYVDPADGALCCYIPVIEDMVLKLRGRCSGTTLTIAHDVAVDGVLRKSNATVAKTVAYQSNKKLDYETFLYQTDIGVLDTEMKVGVATGVKSAQSDGKETVGTIEFRLWFLRQFNDEHEIDKSKTYYKTADNEEVWDNTAPPITYRTLEPEFKMSFERNCAALDKGNAKRQQNKMDAKRPAKEPWIIFRFHYRSQAAIDQHHLPVTYNPYLKDPEEAHIVEIEPVPDLKVGTKQPQRKGRHNDVSTPTSSHNAQPNPPTPPTAKRAKPNVTVTTTTTTPTIPVPTPPVTTPSSPSLSPITEIELSTLTLPALRKKLRRLRAQREKVAARQAEVSGELAPYEDLVARERERVRREVEVQMGEYSEEVERLRDDERMLGEFRGAV
ncbi:hypothetical protein P280DRAFT_392960 [Massarina eburnea CBS 473.64]|uniref:Uncharacterized protein n=1 Tax=Massarina eburnea CBS 473.64 TaxID=1395130 RepID=A0A6A6SBL9_9PLEO|nr:hypothetical protein P280DRAFT_392960 [Massarina eburnea CBS 473.64]